MDKQMQTKDVDLDKLNRENIYEWVTPVGKCYQVENAYAR